MPKKDNTEELDELNPEIDEAFRKLAAAVQQGKDIVEKRRRAMGLDAAAPDEWTEASAKIRLSSGEVRSDAEVEDSHDDCILPIDAAARKALPVATGFVDYFPKAMMAVAELSRIGNDQHNPGEPLHWAREKSTDESDALMRHFLDRGKIDSDGVRHSVKVAWRAMALLEKELEGTKA